MARKLTAGVIVVHPETGAPTFLAEGVDLPDWADGLIKDHVLSATEAEPVTRRAKRSE